MMLDEHYASTNNVIGNWKDVAIVEGRLEGEPVFDLEDEAAKKIAGKVERGFIKGCSMGVTFDRDKMKQQPDGSWILSECELFEVSIVAIPSNRNAVRLFSVEGVEMKEEEVKLAVSELQAGVKMDFKNDKQKMDKIELSATSLVALGLQTQPANKEELDANIATLATKLKTETEAHEATKLALKKGLEAQAKALVNDAKLAGKITADEVDELVKDATENYALTAKYLGRIPAKMQLGAKGSGAGVDAGLPKTLDEFEKLSADAKLAFKTDSPDEYKALFR